MWTLLFVFLALSTHEVLAHNWLRQRSRAAFASTLKPCLPRRNFDYPHIMVAAGVGPGGRSQHFQAEWATG